jgi:thiamine pyrophosphate-dependent acetolactate synthase large subunit-like protein
MSVEPTPPAAETKRQADVQATFVATLVDEWIRAGLTDAVLCPGSRSTPLALALAARTELQIHVRLDERSGGFFALGMALSQLRPVVICTTSGTAAAELHAAVAEADSACVPLLVCTDDHPERPLRSRHAMAVRSGRRLVDHRSVLAPTWRSGVCRGRWGSSRARAGAPKPCVS